MTLQKDQIAPEKGGTSLRDRTWFWALTISLFAFGGTFFLYWEALSLPFFFDDMIHLRWLDWHPLAAVWTTAEGLGYYRPLTMSFWEIGRMALGYYNPALSHALNLFFHGVSAALTGYVAWRLWPGKGQRIFAILATLFFLSYPFSFQAVPSSSSLSKPLIAALMLASVALYWEARRRNARWLILLSLLAGFLAPFAYESGIMTPLAILTVEVVGWYRKEFERPSWAPVWFFLLIWGVSLPIILLAEPDRGGSLIPGLSSLWANGIFFSQGLLFPISFLATPLAKLLPLDHFILLAVISVVTLVILVIFFQRHKRMVEFLYALSWFAIGVLPLWLTLDFGYVINGARLLYLGAVGSALLWAGVPALLWTRAPSRWWAKTLAIVITIGILLFNVAYVRHKMNMATTISTPLWQAVAAAKEQGDSASLLYVNVPGWVAPKEPTYSVGTEGFTFIPEYVRVQDFLFVNSGAEPKTTAVMFDPVKQDRAIYLGDVGDHLDWQGLADEIRRADSVYLTTYTPDAMQIVEVGGLEPNAAAVSAPIANFDDKILLLDSEAEVTGNELTVTLWWRVAQTPEQDVTLFLHVYDKAGNLLAQGDAYPLAGLFPPRQWRDGDVIRDVRRVLLPDEALAGSFVVAVGWYDRDSGERLPAFDQDGQRLPQDAALIYRQ